MLKIDSERLVLGYLIDNKYEASAEYLMKESSELKDFNEIRKKGKKLILKLVGLTLTDILEDFFKCKELVSDLGEKFPGTFCTVPKIASLTDQLEAIYQLGVKTQHQMRAVSKSFNKLKDKRTKFKSAFARTTKHDIPTSTNYELSVCSPTPSMCLHNEPLHTADGSNLLNTSIPSAVEISDADIPISEVDPCVQLSEDDHCHSVSKIHTEELHRSKHTPSKRKGVVRRNVAYEGNEKKSTNKDGERVQTFLKSLISSQEMPERIADFINQKWSKADARDDCTKNDSRGNDQQLCMNQSSRSVQEHQIVTNISTELSNHPMFSALIGQDIQGNSINAFGSLDDGRSLSTPQPTISPHGFDLLNSHPNFSNDSFMGNPLMEPSTNVEIDHHLNQLESNFTNAPNNDNDISLHQVFTAGPSMTTVPEGTLAHIIKEISPINNETNNKALTPSQKRKRSSPNDKSVKKRKSIFDLTDGSFSESNQSIHDVCIEDKNQAVTDNCKDTACNIMPTENRSPVIPSPNDNVCFEVRQDQASDSTSEQPAISKENDEIDNNNVICNNNNINKFYSEKSAIDSDIDMEDRSNNLNLQVPSDNRNQGHDINSLHESIQETTTLEAICKSQNSSQSDTISLCSPSQSLLADIPENVLIEPTDNNEAQTRSTNSAVQNLMTVSPGDSIKSVEPATNSGIRVNDPNSTEDNDSQNSEDIPDISSKISCHSKRRHNTVSDESLHSQSPKLTRTRSSARLTCSSPYSPMKQLQNEVIPVKSPFSSNSKYLSGTPDHPSDYIIAELTAVEDRRECLENNLPKGDVGNLQTTDGPDIVILTDVAKETVDLSSPAGLNESLIDKGLNEEPKIRKKGRRRKEGLNEEPKIRKKGRPQKEGTTLKPKIQNEKNLKKSKAQKLRMLKAKNSPKKWNRKKSDAEKIMQTETRRQQKQRKPPKSDTEVCEDMSNGIKFALNAFRTTPAVPVYAFQSCQQSVDVSLQNKAPTQTGDPSMAAAEITPHANNEPELANAISSPNRSLNDNEVFTFSVSELSSIVDKLDTSSTEAALLAKNAVNKESSSAPLNNFEPSDPLSNETLDSFTSVNGSINLNNLLSQSKKWSRRSRTKIARQRSSSVHVSPKVSSRNSRACKSTPRNKSHVRILDFGTPEKGKWVVNPVKAKTSLDFSPKCRYKLRENLLSFKPNLSNIHETSREHRDFDKDSTAADIENVSGDLYLSEEDTLIPAASSTAVALSSILGSYTVPNSIIDDVIGSIETPGKYLECDNLTLPSVAPSNPTSNRSPSDELFCIGNDLEVSPGVMPPTPQGKLPSIRKYPSGPYSDSSEGTPYQPTEYYSPMQRNLEEVLVNVAQALDIQPDDCSTDSSKASTKETHLYGLSEEMSQSEIENLFVSEISVLMNVRCPPGAEAQSKSDMKNAKDPKTPKPRAPTKQSKPKAPAEKKPPPKTKRTRNTKSRQPEEEKPRASPKRRAPPRQSRRAKDNLSKKTEIDRPVVKSRTSKTTKSPNQSRETEAKRNSFTDEKLRSPSSEASPGLCLEESSDSEEGASPDMYKLLERKLSILDGKPINKRNTKRAPVRIPSDVTGRSKFIRTKTRNTNVLNASPLNMPNLLERHKSVITLDDSDSSDASGTSLMAFKALPNTPKKVVHNICRTVVIEGAMVAIPTPTKDNNTSSDHSDGDEGCVSLSMSNYIDIFSMNI